MKLLLRCMLCDTAHISLDASELPDPERYRRCAGCGVESSHMREGELLLSELTRVIPAVVAEGLNEGLLSTVTVR